MSPFLCPDRSEFVAWNSAAGLADALRTIRAQHIPAGGNVSAMAHSMGNIPLAEALYQNQAAGAAGNKLVDTAIMSQAALSSAYFSDRADLLPSIYRPREPDEMLPPWYNHVTERTLQHSSPDWTEYLAFRPYGQDLDVIGGRTPRFRSIGQAAGKLLNYYNPDDYALGSWKVVQELRPTSEWSNGATLWDMKGWIDFGNVDLGLAPDGIVNWFRGRDVPGFAETEYDIEHLVGAEYRIVRKYTGQTQHEDVGLSYTLNKYEMFAFGASSIVATSGAVSHTVMPGVFTGGRDLRAFTLPDGTTKWNANSPGHSAQFVHSYSGVKGYWDELKADIE